MVCCRPAHLHVCIAAAFVFVTVAGCASLRAAPVRLVEPGDIGQIPGPLDVRRVIEFRIVDQDLLVNTALEPTGGMKRVDVAGVPGTARVSVHVRSRPDVPVVGLYYRLMHVAPESEDAPRIQTTVYTRPGYLELSRVVNTPEELLSVTLTQRAPATAGPLAAPERVTLRVRRVDTGTNRTTVDVQRMAPSVIDLLRHAPREAAEHLGPILRTFDQEAAIFGADLQLAWQVLADVLPVDPAVAPAVDKLVAGLDHDDFRRREAAYEGLRRLGGQAALLLLRRPLGPRLSAEQRSKIEAFLADYRPLSDDEAAERRRDPDFLLSCVAYSPDLSVRLAAAGALRPQDPKGLALAAAALEDAEARATATEPIREAMASPAQRPPAGTPDASPELLRPAPLAPAE